MKKVAVIDIGTNSTRLLVAEVYGNRRIEPLYSELKTTRLGQGIKGGVLLPEAVARTLDAVGEMTATARRMGAVKIVAAATSAVRDAHNREWFLDQAYRGPGVRVRVLEGREEAYLSYLGVSAGFPGGLTLPVIVDIGGGSTEFTWTGEGRTVCRSVNAGAVRMTEGGFSRRDILSVIGGVLDEVRRDSPRDLIGVGGTVTTLAAMDMKLEVYSRELVHGYALTFNRVCGLLEELVGAGPEERKRMPGLQPARADIIVAGVQILVEVMNGLGFDRIRVSEADLMYGLALQAIEPVETLYGVKNQK